MHETARANTRRPTMHIHTYIHINIHTYLQKYNLCFIHRKNTCINTCISHVPSGRGMPPRGVAAINATT
jgi:hypothetical protein